MNIREFICKGPETLNPVLEVLTWSFSQLALGYHPRLDMHGNPYQGKYTAGSPIQGLSIPAESGTDISLPQAREGFGSDAGFFWVWGV